MMNMLTMRRGMKTAPSLISFVRFQTREYRVGILGAGRIGSIHAQSLTRAGAEVCNIADPVANAAQSAAEKYGIPHWTTDPDEILHDESIDAVVICSPTNFHASQIEQAAKAGKHVFCEKPIDLSIETVTALLPKVKASGVQLMVGFNRRFDANFARIRQAISCGEIGDVNMIRITSRDPGPPPIEYIKVSGGIFCDMTIHDFDLARFLTGDEVEEVYATGTARDKAIGDAGDIDTAICVLKFKNGAIGYIENSREAAYGYDQRVEVLGTKGAVETGNNHPNNVTISDGTSVRRDKPLNFFLERYMGAYVTEIEQFIKACKTGTQVPVGGEDGRKALLIAKACDISRRENRPVRISEVDMV